MNSKGHFIISMIKSWLRLFGCVACVLGKNFTFAMWTFGIAECFGIIEELVDKR